MQWEFKKKTNKSIRVLKERATICDQAYIKMYFVVKQFKFSKAVIKRAYDNIDFGILQQHVLE